MRVWKYGGDRRVSDEDMAASNKAIEDHLSEPRPDTSDVEFETIRWR